MRWLPVGLVGAAVAVLAPAAAVAQASAPPAPAAQAPVRVVAAENMYGDIARQIGGSDVAVTSILTNPDQDPHLFETSPSVARELSGAAIVIENGADYDPWMASLLRATPGRDRTVIDVATLLGRKPGDNPHLWYDPAAPLAVATALADALRSRMPGDADAIAARLDRFRASLQPIDARIASLRARVAGQKVTATEPVLGLLLQALGLDVRNRAFQLAVMNNTEPAASSVAAFERDLRTHQVRLLVYNSQASDPIAARMERIARAAHVPVVGATETEPPNTTIQVWIAGTLEMIGHALAAP